MKVSAKTEYACMAMLELAASYDSGQPMRIRDIAQRHQIPSRFLVQILLQLKGSGLVASTRGAAGGYRLVDPPHQVTLGQVMRVIEGQEGPLTSNSPDGSPTVAVLGDVWREIAETRQNILVSVTLADLVERAKVSSDNMYYI